MSLEIATVTGVSFELLPEQVDLAGFTLQGAGLGALIASALATVRQVKASKRARWVEVGNAWGAGLAVAAFVGQALVRAVL